MASVGSEAVVTVTVTDVGTSAASNGDGNGPTLTSPPMSPGSFGRAEMFAEVKKNLLEVVKNEVLQEAFGFSEIPHRQQVRTYLKDVRYLSHGTPARLSPPRLSIVSYNQAIRLLVYMCVRYWSPLMTACSWHLLVFNRTNHAPKSLSFACWSHS
jgi:hypothetical protein